jgi:hypothetical protein
MEMLIELNTMKQNYAKMLENRPASVPDSLKKFEMVDGDII